MTIISKGSVTFFHVNDMDAGQRLDNFLLRHLKGVPKSHIYKIIRAGEVRINRARTQANYRIKAQDEVRIPPVRVAKHLNLTMAPATTFPVVYEDHAILVINKPAGVAVHGGSGVSFGVIEQLRHAHPSWPYLELVHRLDRDTSGLLLLAKKRSALTQLHATMRGNLPDKRYLALCIGQWPDALHQVQLPLYKYHTASGERQVVVSANGQYAYTHFTVKERLGEFTLLEACLHTGRTHQIRVHMQAQNHPIAGDEKYGCFALNKTLARQGLKRMFLHAHQLCIPHPLTNAWLEFTTPLPNELQWFLGILRSKSGIQRVRS